MAGRRFGNGRRARKQFLDSTPRSEPETEASASSRIAREEVCRFLRVATDGLVEFSCVRLDEDGVVRANLMSGGDVVRVSYMDESKSVRRICTDIAESLRERVDRNVYFDLVDGRMSFWV